MSNGKRSMCSPYRWNVQAKRMRIRIRMNHVSDVRTPKSHKEIETWNRAQHMESVLYMRK